MLPSPDIVNIFAQPQDEPAPLSDQEKRLAMANHYERVFTDESVLEDRFDVPTIFGDKKPSMRLAANTAFLADKNDRDITPLEYGLLRDAYAKEHFGKETVTDGEFFEGVKGQFEKRKQTREGIEELQSRAVAAAIQDEIGGTQRQMATKVFEEWKAGRPEIAADAKILAVAGEAYRKTIEDIDTVRPVAAKGYKLLNDFADGKTTEDDELRDFARELVGMSDEHRQKAMGYIALAARYARKGQDPKSVNETLETLSEGFGKALARGFDWIPQFGSQITERSWIDRRKQLDKGVLFSLVEGEQEVSARALPELKEQADAAIKFFKIRRELDAALKEEINPIERVAKGGVLRAIEGGAYGFAGSLGFMAATAVNPGFGVAAYHASEYNRIMLQNPDMDPDAANVLALLEGSGNAAIDMLQLRGLAGLPMFGKYLKGIKGAGWQRASGFALVTAEQNLQEAAQDLIAPVAESIAASLREDMPDKVFKKEMAEYWKSRPEVFFAVLPFGLIGGGFAGVNALKPGSINTDRLLDAGFSDEQAQSIMASSTVEQATAAIEEEWQKRTPENIEAGKERIVERVGAAFAENENPETGSIRVERGPEGTRQFVVTDPVGARVLSTEDPDTALEALRQTNAKGMLLDQDSTAEAVRYFQDLNERDGRGEDVQQFVMEDAPRSLLEELEENDTPENSDRLLERIKIAGGEGKDRSELSGWMVKGTNRGAIREGVYRSVVKLQKGANALTVFEEFGEDFTRRALSEGAVTKEWLIERLREAEKSLGETYLSEEATEQEIVEGVSKLGVAYVTGRRKDAALPDGLRGFIRQLAAIFRDILKRSYRLKRAFAKGEIGKGFEGFLARSVGFDAQEQVEVMREAAEREIAGQTHSIARINRAFTRVSKAPTARIETYEKARLMLDRARSRRDLNTRGADARLAETLQSLAELDAVLSVLPAAIRGRIGGHAKLAEINPTDLFKGNRKVAVAKSGRSAIISAWMREGANIGDANKKTELPDGYTVKENNDPARLEESVGDFFVSRIKAIDRELERVLAAEYRDKILDALKKAKPKVGDAGVKKSTLGPAQELADKALRATLLDADETAKRLEALESQIDAGNTDPALAEEWALTQTFGDIDSRDSATLAAGLEWLAGALKRGREQRKIENEARLVEIREARAVFVDALGRANTPAEYRASKENWLKRSKQLASGYIRDHLSFEQFLKAILEPEGKDPSVAGLIEDLFNRVRVADNQYVDAAFADTDGLHAALKAAAKASGKSLGAALVDLKTKHVDVGEMLVDYFTKPMRLTIEQATKIVRGEINAFKVGLGKREVDGLRSELAALPQDSRKEYVTIYKVVSKGRLEKLSMTKAQAVQVLLMWQQRDVQEKMRRTGWTDGLLANITSLVRSDPVAVAALAHLRAYYAESAARIGPVYYRIFGMNLPRVSDYAPTRFRHTGDTQETGPDGSAIASGSIPGFLKGRVSHAAAVAQSDAFDVFHSFVLERAHWAAFAEVARDFKAIISDSGVRRSVELKHGTSAVAEMDSWQKVFERRGGDRAREAAWMNGVLGAMISGKAIGSLGFNLKSGAMQLDSVSRPLFAMDPKKVVASLLDPKGIASSMPAVWNSPTIQRRLRAGSSAELRFLADRAAAKPGVMADTAGMATKHLIVIDSALTTVGGAIVYRDAYSEAIRAGASEKQAADIAAEALDKAIYRFSQPIMTGNRSRAENTGGILQKTFMLFLSDARLKTAIMSDAVRRLKTDPAGAIKDILVLEAMALITHVVASMYLDAFSDDDDEEIWGLGGFARAALLAPFQGYFILGAAWDVAVSKAITNSFFQPSRDPVLENAGRLARAWSAKEYAFDPDDTEAMFRFWDNLSKAAAISPASAVPAAAANLIKPVIGAKQNAETED